jgi:hypothetical protein
MEPRRAARPDPARSETQLLDLDTLGIPLDNVEGLTLGPQLRTGGARSCSSATTNQFMQLLPFAVG